MIKALSTDFLQKGKTDTLPAITKTFHIYYATDDDIFAKWLFFIKIKAL